MSFPVLVQLSKRFYFCQECNEEHEYSDEVYQFHQQYARDFGRWLYEEKS